MDGTGRTAAPSASTRTPQGLSAIGCRFRTPFRWTALVSGIIVFLAAATSGPTDMIGVVLGSAMMSLFFLVRPTGGSCGLSTGPDGDAHD
ncbi:MAG: hypothetical protein DRQ37_00235 [Gammaproteobacteria bacterium]|nr:MAG: hypothetical protein DRQ37_00235 [Gammaproteobacteria bacterium]